MIGVVGVGCYVSEEGIGKWGGISDTNTSLEWEEVSVDSWEVGLSECFGDEASEGVGYSNGSDPILFFWNSD